MILPSGKILVVEDNPGDARLIQELLKEATAGASLAVVVAKELSTALEVLKDTSIQIVLLDLGLPDSQGLSALSHIVEAEPGVPVVILTGSADESLGLQALRAGAQDYLTKSDVNGRLLVRAIRLALERKQMEQERKAIVKELIDSIAHVRTLSGLLPICSSCKKIRDDKGYWNQLEEYILKHSDARFTHGMCPDCMATLYPDHARLDMNSDEHASSHPKESHDPGPGDPMEKHEPGN